MNAIEIQDVWQAIRESERSDEIPFIDQQLLIKAEAIRLTQQPDQSGAVGFALPRRMHKPGSRTSGL